MNTNFGNIPSPSSLKWRHPTQWI